MYSLGCSIICCHGYVFIRHDSHILNYLFLSSVKTYSNKRRDIRKRRNNEENCCTAPWTKKVSKLSGSKFCVLGGFQLLDLIIRVLKVTWPVIIQCFLLVEITAVWLESKSRKGFYYKQNFHQCNERPWIFNRSFEFHPPVFKKVTSAGLNSYLQKRW